MTETLIALISIVIGIIGANITGKWFTKFDLGFTGSTLAGVFGSIFLIKSVGRLGFDPVAVMQSGNVDILLLIINFTVSLIGGSIAVIFAKKLRIFMNKSR
ncbi:MAG: hypothetical protein DSY82_06365 [Flavobacteriia bacterium]|nr:MAG: hypothetical protein DSY82_06365 [Flavobacteriia bacterium]